ncbi:MAG: prepilin peptidase [Sarcina sp.]
MTFLVFLYGIVIGSFLNVCIYRIPAEKSIVRPPSACGNCNTTLKWKDLIPVVSYLSVAGKCRYCREKISLRYPLIEILTGVLITGLFFKYGLTYEFFKFAILVLVLIVIAFIDYDTTDVYSITTIPIIITGILLILLENLGISVTITEYIKNVALGLSGGLVAAAVIAFICYAIGGMGEGDIEIAAMIGVFIGLKMTIFFILLSFIIGGIYGVILIITKLKSKNDYIAFGPSLAMAAYVTILLGNEFISKNFLPF